MDVIAMYTIPVNMPGQNGSCAVKSGLSHVCAAPELTSGTPLPGMTNLALIITWLFSTHMSSQSAVGIVSLVYLSNETRQPEVSIVLHPELNYKFGAYCHVTLTKPQLDWKSSYAVLQTTFSNSFSWIKIIVFSFKYSTGPFNQH